MQFVLYTEKTVSQSMLALNERLHNKSGKLDGWTEKSGSFSIAVTCNVMRRFNRTTRLEGRIERENNLTVIRGHVSEGADLQRRAVIYGLLVLAGAFFFLRASVLPGVIALLAPLALNIPLEGDNINSQFLMAEVQRTLKAKETPPKTEGKKASGSRKASASGKTSSGITSRG